MLGLGIKTISNHQTGNN